MSNEDAEQHYAFGGRFVAARSPGGALSFLFHDQVNSAIYTTDAYVNKIAARGCYAFGAPRFSQGMLPTDCTFTGQQEHGAGGSSARLHPPTPPHNLTQRTCNRIL